MNKKFLKLLFSVVCLLFFVITSNSYSASEALLKTSAEISYKNLLVCIKKNNNDISKCLNNFEEYLKHEKKLILNFKNDRYTNRLVKMVSYLKDSTDIFLEKARSSGTKNDWEKAYLCSKLLYRISSKYESYGEVFSEYKKINQGDQKSASFSALLNKIDSGELSDSSLNEYSKMIDKIGDDFSYLRPDFKESLLNYANEIIIKFPDFVTFYNENLINQTHFRLTNIDLWYEFYKVSIRIPGVIDNTNEIKSKINELCNNIDEYSVYLERFKEQLNKACLKAAKAELKEKFPLPFEYIIGLQEEYKKLDNLYSGKKLYDDVCKDLNIPDNWDVGDKYLCNLNGLKKFYDGHLLYNEERFIAALSKLWNAKKNNNLNKDLYKKTDQVYEIVSKKVVADINNIDSQIDRKKVASYNDIINYLEGVKSQVEFDSKFDYIIGKVQKEIVLDLKNKYLQGTFEIQHIHEAIFAYSPNKNLQFLLFPPLEGPKEKGEYYSWPCIKQKKVSNEIFCYDYDENSEYIYMIDNIIYTTPDYSPKMESWVIGKYNRNTEVKYFDGRIETVPILEDCLVFAPSDITSEINFDLIISILSKY